MSGKFLVNGAELKCRFGEESSKLVVLPNVGMAGDAPMATIKDFVPKTNILPFGKCRSPTNPAVIAATAANFGRLTPQPCKPKIELPWLAPSPVVELDGRPVLTEESTCACELGGTIRASDAGQGDVEEL